MSRDVPDAMTSTNWMRDWPWSAPRDAGPWTVRNGDEFGLIDPETGVVSPVEPRADRRLPGIARALDAGGRLLGYRYRRRAVLAHDAHHTKVVRPERVAALVARHEAVRRHPDFDTPEVVDVHDDGRVDITTLPGSSLHRRNRAGESLQLDRVARAIAGLHATPSPVGSLPIATVDPSARWIGIVGRIDPGARPALEAVAATLPGVDIEPVGLVHTDLHDKNVIVTPDRIGIIDLDGLALGPAELDVANLAVHLELRGVQTDRHDEGADRASHFIEHYATHRALDHELVRALRRHTWFRLACLYQCRGADRRHVLDMLDRATSG